MRRKRIALLSILLVSFLVTSSVMAMASPSYAIEWMVPLSGGGGHASSTNYAIDLTYGQTASGHTQSPGYQAGLGFWYGIQDAIWDLFMPLIIRN